MAKPRILLTGDDGYNSNGTRVLINCLKEKYDLMVVGTLNQQSAVGGKMSLADGFDWGLTTVDGVKAIWVDGTPVDAMELASDYFSDDGKFDMIISGINWGTNLGTAIYSSGTVNAAIRGLMTQLAPKALCFSWDLPGDHWTKEHTIEQPIDEYLQYPGTLACQLVELAQTHRFWGTELININFPMIVTHKAKITRLTADSTKVYQHEILPNKEGGHYRYAAYRVKNPDLSDECDAQALNQGWISITPCKVDFTNQKAFAQYQDFSQQL